MYHSLHEYIDALERVGQLLRVSARVSSDEEIAELTDRAVKAGAPALLFTDTGTAFPVATNLFGSAERMAMALGVESIEQISQRIDALVAKTIQPPTSALGKLAMLPLLGEASKWLPRRSSRRGRCQDVVLEGEAASLGMLPVLKCWPHDGGRFITLPLVNTVDPETGAANMGMYRMQIFGERTAALHWHVHKTGARHYDKYKALGRRMPVSVCLGGDPAYTYAATAPLPEGVDENLFVGFLRSRAVRLVKCVTNDLYVPSDCDFVIEGYVDTAEEKVIEGPFGDHTGFYSLEDRYPLMHVTAITHRSDAVYPATVVGIPPQEDAFVALATERIFLAPIRLALQPEIRDLWMPVCGVAHNLAVVNISSHYPAQARKVISALWGAGQMMFNKYMLVVASDGDIRDTGMLASLIAGADMQSAVVRGQGVLDVLDHATATVGCGGKLALDLTCCKPAEGNSDIGDVVKFLFADPQEPVYDICCGLDERVKVVFVIDRDAESLDFADRLWIALADSSPERDASLIGGRLIVDARTKLPDRADNPSRFPNVVVSSAATVSLVDRRWEEYGIGEFVPSPSEHYRPLAHNDKAQR